MLSAFRSAADTLVSLDENANTLAQTSRAENAARVTRSNIESRYKFGATPFYATLTAVQRYEARALNRSVEQQRTCLSEVGDVRRQAVNTDRSLIDHR